MIDKAVDWAVYSAIGLDTSSEFGHALNFFLYDTIKIFILLFVMISIIGFLRSYIPERKIKQLLSGKKQGVGNLLAAVFGAITPFCSCSSIPIFFGFLKAGVPLGVTFSFLITSPIINEYVFVLMWGFFGWKIAIAYVISGLLIGIVAGVILGKMKLEHLIEKDIKINQKGQTKKFNRINQRIIFGINEATDIIKKLWLWIIVAVGIAAAIHNYVPESVIQNIVGSGGIFTVPIAVLLGVPLYGSCAAIVPIAVVLFEKGVPLGTALAFMMAIAALSLPEAIMLRRAMKLKLIAIFFGIVTLSIVITGYIFNILAPLLT
jgi:hypothetical protein